MDIRIILIALLVLIAEGIVLFWHFRIKPISKKLVNQLLFLETFLCTFLLCATFSEATVHINYKWLCAWSLVTILPWIFLVWLRWNIRSKRRPRYTQALLNHKWEILLVLITFFSRIWLTDTLQKWDSSEYYYTIMKLGERFDLSLKSFLTAFRLLAHPSYGFAIWASLGEYITPQNVEGVLTVSVLLTCGASVCLFRILREHWTKLPDWQAFLGVLMCLAIPLYWAGSACTMPDYYMALFIVFMIYSDYRQNNILLFFWGGMAAFCKETGMVLVAAYFAAKVFCCFFCGKASVGQRFKRVFANRVILAGMGIGLVIIVYLLLSTRLSAWSHSVYYSQPMTWSGSGKLLYNTFGLQADNILTRLKEYFIVNFTWLLTGGLIAALVIRASRGEGKKEFHTQAVVETVAILVTYGLFMCLYITAGSIRYNVVFTLLFSALAYAVMAKVFRRKTLTLFACALTVAFGVQSFRSIDVVTNLMFRTTDVGQTSLLCIAQESHLNPGGDYYITNLQYRSLHENFEKMLAQLNWQEEDTLLVAGEDYAQCANNSALSEFGGRRGDIRWNPWTKQLKNSIDSRDYRINLLTTNQLWGLKQLPSQDQEAVDTVVESALDSVKGRLFVYFSPVYQSGDTTRLIAQLEQVFELGEIQTVETDGNVLSFCQLTPKPEKDWTLAQTDITPTGTPEEIAQKFFYRSLRPLAVQYDGSRTDVRPGDTIAVTIACYDTDGSFLNMETSPKGTVLTDLVIGTGSNVDGVDQALIGVNVGETVTVECTFPAAYRYRPELEGKTIVMEITVNRITNMLPEITDRLISDRFGYDSVDAYIDEICRQVREGMLSVDDGQWKLKES